MIDSFENFFAMPPDPDFVKKIKERKARREALEKRIPTAGKHSKKGGKLNSGPVFRSVSLLTGEETYITGEEARKRVEKSKYRGD